MTVMRFTHDGIEVKSMLVPDVDACTVPEVRTPTPVGVPAVTGLVNVGLVNATPDTILDEDTLPAVFGIAFSTLET
jgi:hypothetical protein